MASNINLKNISIEQITADTIESVANVDTSPKAVRWHGLLLAIKPLLSFEEMTRFVNSVMDACFDEEHNIAIPEAIDFSIRVNVIVRYSNITLPVSIEKQMQIVYGTDLYETIMSHVSSSQLNAIVKAIDLCTNHIL